MSAHRVHGTALALLAWFCSAPASIAQSQLWIEQVGTEGFDDARGAAPDGSGGIYLGGLTHGALAGSYAGGGDAWLARFDAAGEALWMRQIGTPEQDLVAALAPIAAGGCFASGVTGGNLGGPSAGVNDPWLARYDEAGRQVWMLQFGTPDWDEVTAAAPDGMGGVHLIGITDGSLGGPSSGSFDAWMARYDGTGELFWVRQRGTSASDHALAGAPDGTGGLYVAGHTRGHLGGPSAGDTDAWIARYDEWGSELWIRQLGTGSSDDVRAAAPDGVGGVFVGGNTRGALAQPSAGDQDAWLARFDASGRMSWIRQLGTGGPDSLLAAASDAYGGVYVTGSTEGSLGGTSAGGAEVWLAHYDGSGSLQQLHQLGTSGHEIAEAAATDGAGGVVAAGFTTGSLGGASAGSVDAWLGRLDPCAIASYCIGAINSTGQGAAIGSQGSTSISQNDLVLTVADCPASVVGLFFLGQSKIQVPFGEGWLCVSGSTQRLLPAVSLSPSGAGSYAVDFTDPLSPASAIAPGTVRQLQFWYRDPQPIGHGYNLSDALSAYFCP